MPQYFFIRHKCLQFKYFILRTFYIAISSLISKHICCNLLWHILLFSRKFFCNIFSCNIHFTATILIFRYLG